MGKNNYVSCTSDKSKKTAFFLCLFGGIMGVHDFYLGKFGKGFIKLLTGNIFLLGYFRDLIKIKSGTYLDGAGQPVRK